MKPLQVYKTRQSGQDTTALVPGDEVYFRTIASTIEETITVPAGAQVVLFESSLDFWVDYDNTAVVPVADAGPLTVERNPGMRFVGDIAVLHIISSATGDITVSFFG